MNTCKQVNLSIDIMKQHCIDAKIIRVIDLEKVVLIDVWYAIIVYYTKRKEVQNEKFYR